MALFDQMMGAVTAMTNGNSQANGMGALLGQLQNIPGADRLDPAMLQSVINIATGHVQGALKEKVATDGIESVQGVVNQATNQASEPAQGANIINMLLNGAQQQNLMEAVTRKTGLDSGIIQNLIPIVMPLILNLIQGNNQSDNTPDSPNMLSAFLDSNHDGKTDLMDMMALAGQFMKR